ncbi:MAG: hypothetical protein EXR99_00545 [Gemmataceae bacterium]|nr:hypothetical protein [Gemmataceae bacterium]
MAGLHSALLAFSLLLPNQDFHLTVSSKEKIAAGTVIQAAIPQNLSPAGAKVAVLKDAAGKEVALGQAILTSPLDKVAGKKLVTVLPELSVPPEGLILSGYWTNKDFDNTFSWKDINPELSQLSLGGKPVWQYVHPVLKEGKDREATYKPFHHVFDLNGLLVTKGPGGQFTHHRGLFLGFNKITYGNGIKVDIWHCKDDTHQAHDKVLFREGGPVCAAEEVTILWKGKGKETFATEQRELTVYQAPGGRLLEFQSEVKTTGGKIQLDGDPQHAGFHFRASNEVADKTSKETIFIRPNGADKPGASKNWPQDKSQVNLPWLAMSFVLDGKRRSAVYLDHPSNPKESRFSERPYGRFGSYFEYEITPEKPLRLQYRVWLQDGQIDVQSAVGKNEQFVNPPNAVISK